MLQIGDIIEGSLHCGSTGSGYLVHPDLPKDIYVFKNNLNKALHLDTVRIILIEGKGRPIEGQVIEIIERFRTEFVGTIQVSPKYAFFIPDSNKIPYDFYIPINKILGAVDGQKVVVKLTKWKDNAKSPNGEVIRVLGNAGDNETEIHAILHEYGLPYEFTGDVLAEAEAIPAEITEKEIAKRRDFRDVTTIGIDGIDSKDADDVIGVKSVDDNYEISINIADVTHYVRPNTDIDKEAYKRGTSVYLVDRCVPMLPERLSNEICSLKAGSDKLCFSAVFTFDSEFNIIDKWFGRTVINVNKDYTYEDAQDVIENGIKIGTEETDRVVLVLNDIAKSLRKERVKNGFLELNKQEVRFKLDENNRPIDLIFKISKDSNKLIEEFMLLANKEVGAFIKSKGLPCINRVHESPNIQKLKALQNYVSGFGYHINIDDSSNIKSELNNLLHQAKDSPEEDIISTLVTRTQQKAFYTTMDLGHYGLGFTDYTHFTSGIRRYSDILAHRLLMMALDNKIHKINIDKLEARCAYLSERERKAAKAERDSVKLMQTLYMSERIGKMYKGLITSITEYGVFISITENSCEGFVKLTEIGGDVFTSDMNNYCVKGTKTGEVIRLGDSVNIVVQSVDLEKKNINFSLIRL